uniref:Apple domain-containing protein n=1 Tax=Clytia hemisphaerica TaxID=252671 RepID=A0A7M5WZS9_9CNID
IYYQIRGISFRFYFHFQRLLRGSGFVKLRKLSNNSKFYRMRLIFLSIAAFLNFVFGQIMRLPQCNKYGATFKVSKRKLKVEAKFDAQRLNTHEKIKSKEICSSLCIENDDCQSAFYGRLTKKCFLYNKKFDPDELEESDTMFYLTTAQNDGDNHHGHACASNKCNPKGTEKCEETCEQPNGYKCYCLKGFGGDFCEERLLCNRTIKPIGCFADSPSDRAMAIFIGNYRDDIDWDNYEVNFEEILCKCIGETE